MKFHYLIKNKKIIIPISLLLGIIMFVFKIHSYWINIVKSPYFLPKTIDGRTQFVHVLKRPKNWVSIGSLDKKFYEAIRISEDWAFFEHHGLDMEQISQALAEKINDENKKLRGASTITQQLSKNLFTNKRRSFFRKFKEFIYTIFLEQYLDKKSILEIYLNIVHLGPNLYGVVDASKHYFDKDVKKLGARHGAFLAMLLPSPNRYNISFIKKELTDFAKKTMDNILFKMSIAGIIKKDKLNKIISDKFKWEKAEIEENKQTETTYLVEEDDATWLSGEM